MSKLIEIKHLAKSFGSQQVLKDINMTVNGNENIAVLGKSGTGKSVLLKCIVGLLIADRGTINVFGHDVIQTTEKKLNQIRSRIGYLFQTGALYDSMSIRENLIFPLKRNLNYSVNDEEEMDELVDKNLEQVGLLDAKNK